MKKQFDASKVKANVLTGLLIGVFVGLLFLFFGDVEEVKETFLSIPLIYFLGAIACILSSYILRFVKWHYYLRHIGINIDKKNSFVIFFIGLGMSITPGKIGELLKTYFLKRKYEVPYSKSLPVLFAERLTDLVAMVVLVGTGVFLFSMGEIYFFIGLALLVLFFYVLQKKDFCIRCIKRLFSPKLLKKYTDSVCSFYENVYDLFRWKPLGIATLISIAAWFLECLSIFILSTGLKLNLSLLHHVFIYSLTTTAGALSMVPGGLGVVEGGMTGLFVYFGLTKEEAVAVTLVMRMITLWLGVFIGLALFFCFRKRLGKNL